MTRGKSQLPSRLWLVLSVGDGVWTYDDRDRPTCTASAAASRGDIVRREAAPAGLVTVCDRLRKSPGVSAVHAVAFPVKPDQDIIKQGPTTGSPTLAPRRGEPCEGPTATIPLARPDHRGPGRRLVPGPDTRTPPRRPGRRTPAGRTPRPRSRSRGSTRRSGSTSTPAGSPRPSPQQQRLDLLVRLRGPDHWQADDARRRLATCKQLTAPPRTSRTARRRTTRSGTGEGTLRPGPVRPGRGPVPAGPAGTAGDMGEGHPDIARATAGMSGDPRGPGEVCRRRGRWTAGSWRLPEGTGRGPPRHRHSYETWD